MRSDRADAASRSRNQNIENNPMQSSFAVAGLRDSATKFDTSGKSPAISRNPQPQTNLAPARCDAADFGGPAIQRPPRQDNATAIAAWLACADRPSGSAGWGSDAQQFRLAR